MASPSGAYGSYGSGNFQTNPAGHFSTQAFSSQNGWQLPQTIAAFPTTTQQTPSPFQTIRGSSNLASPLAGGGSASRDGRGGQGERSNRSSEPAAGDVEAGNWMNDWKKSLGLTRGGGVPELPRRDASSRELISDDDTSMLVRQVRHAMGGMAKSWHCKAGLLLFAAAASIIAGILLIISGNGGASGRMPLCNDQAPCPVDWKQSGAQGGFFCEENGGCRPGASGPWTTCLEQCFIQAPGGPPPPALMVPVKGGAPAPAASISTSATPTEAGEATEGAQVPGTLTKAGEYDLRVKKNGKLLGCAAPVGKFPGQPKYGCAGNFATAQTCDAAANPIKDTKYVAAVHAGCETALGRGTYGYAYDDGVGLKQCAPVTKYEWILCPTGVEASIAWEAEPGISHDSTKRFRVTNKCTEPIWIQQAGAAEEVIPKEKAVRKIEAGETYSYSIPNKGLPSTRFLPKTGCDGDGNNCDIQSMPPCPATGCDLPIDTKFEASWGCLHSKGNPKDDKELCAITGQGNPSTYQDWWDGSAVDGWTLPFTVLVDDGGHGLAPGAEGSPEICGPVVCAKLVTEDLCPTNEFLTPES